MQVSSFTSSINGSHVYQKRIHNIASILSQIEIYNMRLLQQHQFKIRNSCHYNWKNYETKEGKRAMLYGAIDFSHKHERMHENIHLNFSFIYFLKVSSLVLIKKTLLHKKIQKHFIYFIILQYNG